MDGTLNPILVDKFSARLGTASALIVFDFRRRNDRTVVSAVVGDVAAGRQWLDDSRDRQAGCLASSAPRRVKRRPQSPCCAMPTSPEAISHKASAADTHLAPARRERLTKEMELGEEHHRAAPFLE
jgi:hypothetical protein